MNLYIFNFIICSCIQNNAGLNRIVGSLQTYVYSKIAMETVYKKLSNENQIRNK